MRVSRFLLIIFLGTCLVLFAGCKKDAPTSQNKPKPPRFEDLPSVQPDKAQPPAARKEEPEIELPLEVEYQAGKLLEYAKMQIELGIKVTTPKVGIETCRQIIADYPGTKYAHEARMQLRRVPQKYHKKYNITPDELGL